MAKSPIKLTDGPVENVEQVFLNGNPVDAWRLVAMRAFPSAELDEEKIAEARAYCESRHD